jgi:glutathione S-transferase
MKLFHVALSGHAHRARLFLSLVGAPLLIGVGGIAMGGDK